MRSAHVEKRRGNIPVAPVDEAVSFTTSLIAPYTGWNAVGNLANMKPTDAVQMDNIFPGVTDVQLRRGYQAWTTGFSGNIRTLIPYRGLTTDKIFASTSSGIYDATSQGAVGGAVTACTNSQWIYVQFTNSGGSYVYLVNGTDAPKAYDGTTWTNPAITGVTPANLKYVVAHKKRLWFIEKDKMSLWYLPTEAIAGAAVEFPVGALFKRGGSLTAIGTWTLDAGAGPDDYFVIVTSNGELAVYRGTDPASSSTWALVGVFDVGIPVGARPFCDFGGDLLYLSQTGLLPLSKLMQSTVISYTNNLSFQIDGAFLDATSNYGSIFGWQVEYYKSGNFLVVNAPITADTYSYQFVMNTVSKAWCRFTNMNASCWATLGNDLYFANGTSTYKAWSGTTDNGSPIVGTVLQAYTNLGVRGQSQVVLARPNMAATASASLVMAIDSDFRTFSDSTTLTYSPVTSSGIWGSSLWDTGLWGGTTASVVDSRWTTIPGNLGYYHAVRMQITTSTAQVTWTNTDFVVRRAGIL